jgi:exonuclease III
LVEGRQMRIVSWNCNGAFRKKYSQVARLDADVYIIQECEDPKTVSEKDSAYTKFTRNQLWQGENKNRGLGVFAKAGFSLEKIELNHDWRGRTLKWFLPFNLVENNQTTKFLGLWNHGADAKAFNYIGQSWLFLQNNREFFRNAIVAGDFNSNSIWDSWDRWWNHSDYVAELSALGLHSLYHSITGEQQGKESQSTFLLQRNKEKKYHIDYIFAQMETIRRTKRFTIHDFDAWIEFSDHVPVEWYLE